MLKELYLLTFVKGPSGLAMFLKWLVFHLCNPGHAGTVKVQKYNWTKIVTVEVIKILSRNFT